MTLEQKIEKLIEESLRDPGLDATERARIAAAAAKHKADIEKVPDDLNMTGDPEDKVNNFDHESIVKALHSAMGQGE